MSERWRETTGGPMPQDTIHRLRIELRRIQPKIWRRIEVPSTYTFWDLHSAIQDAMGWSDSHLHEFRVGRRGREITIGTEAEEEAPRAHRARASPSATAVTPCPNSRACAISKRLRWLLPSTS